MTLLARPSDSPFIRLTCGVQARADVLTISTIKLAVSVNGCLDRGRCDPYDSGKAGFGYPNHIHLRQEILKGETEAISGKL